MNKGQFQIGGFGTSKKWETPEEMQSEIDVYFDYCDNYVGFMYDVMGKKHNISKPLPYTIEGLCVVLDCDRRTLLNYEKKIGYEPYFHTIKKAKRRIQLDKVQKGMNGDSKTAMVIFDLKNNHGYIDKVESIVEQTVTNEIDYSKLDAKGLKELSEFITKLGLNEDKG